MMEFTFEQPVWEGVLTALRQGTSLSAVRFLAMLEEESEEDLQDALTLLDKRDILLDTSDLPAYSGCGEMAERLRLEARLVKEKKLPAALDENDPLRLYLEELAAVPAAGDMQILAQRWAAGEDSAVERLTALCLSLAVEKAFAYAGQGVLLLDLIQEGGLGIWQAIQGYREGNFESICNRVLDRAMAKAVTLQARANGVGQKMRQAMEDYRSVDERLLADLGRNPTLEEIAVELHMSLEEASAVEETLESARMLYRAKADEQTQQSQPEDEQAVEDTAYFQMRQRIADLLGNLDESDTELLTLRFGLEGGLPLSPEETGTRMGLTAQEVVAREAAALSKLRSK